MNRIVLAVCCLAITLGAHPCPAAAQGVPAAPLPAARLWTSATVLALAQLPDGGLLVAGDFVLAEGAERPFLARYRADGTLDPTFALRPDRRVESILVAPDGSIYLSGDFDRIDGSVRRRIARLRPDLTLDTGWNLRFGSTTDDVTAMALGQDGTLFVGGRFTQIVGPDGVLPRINLARVRSDGALDTAWRADVNQPPTSLVVGGDDRLYVGGAFNQIGGLARSRIARVSTTAPATVDGGWNPDPDNDVTLVALDRQQRLHVAGGFTRIGGGTQPHWARLLPDGQLDPAWRPQLRGAPTAIAFAELDRTYVSAVVGDATTSRGRLMRLGPDAMPDPAFAPDVVATQRADSPVRAIVVDDSGALEIGGDIASIAGSAGVAGAARLTSAGHLESGRVLEVPGRVDAIAAHGDGFVAGGRFRRIDDAPRRYLARFDAEGRIDQTWRNDLDGAITAVAAGADGAVYVSGHFGRVADVSRLHLARIGPGGLLDSAWNPGASGALAVLSIGPSGALYAYGNVTLIGGEKRRVARLWPDGSVDPNWLPQINGPVAAIVEVPGFGVYVGGQFSVVNGDQRVNLVRLTADTADVDPQWRPAVNGPVLALLDAGDGSLFVGGNFTNLAGVPGPRLGRISAGGIGAPVAGFVAGDANAIVTRLLIHGGLLYHDWNRTRLRRVQPATGARDPAWEVFVEAELRGFDVFGGPDLIAIGGNLTRVGGAERQGVGAVSPHHLFGHGFEP
ncbi:MAG: delta-60 repeat domain-containing protein [Armatimonadota bacterium]|nr:delta-60 repeat domain-containing protein [Armatimonadota bacterium]